MKDKGDTGQNWQYVFQDCTENRYTVERDSRYHLAAIAKQDAADDVSFVPGCRQGPRALSREDELNTKSFTYYVVFFG